MSSVSDNLLYPRQVLHKQIIYLVHPLSSGLSMPSTPRDFILPCPVAFISSPVTGNAPRYPTFGWLCMWQTLIEQSRQPVLTWECWGPDALGAYRLCNDVWRAWTEGSLVEGVGQKAPLQVVECQWGAKRNLETKKEHQQSWQPSGETNVRSDIVSLICNILMTIMRQVRKK